MNVQINPHPADHPTARPLTDKDHATTAMTLWETYLEDPGQYLATEIEQQEVGICETRERFANLIEPCEAIFGHAVHAGYSSPFDFEFVPDFLQLLTNAADLDDPAGAPRLRIAEADYMRVGALMALRDRAMSATRCVEQTFRAMAARDKPGHQWTAESIEREFFDGAGTAASPDEATRALLHQSRLMLETLINSPLIDGACHRELRDSEVDHELVDLVSMDDLIERLRAAENG